MMGNDAAKPFIMHTYTKGQLIAAVTSASPTNPLNITHHCKDGQILQYNLRVREDYLSKREFTRHHNEVIRLLKKCPARDL